MNRKKSCTKCCVLYPCAYSLHLTLRKLFFLFAVYPLVHAGAKILIGAFDKAELFVEAFFVFGGLEIHHYAPARFEFTFDIIHCVVHKFAANSLSLKIRMNNYISNINYITMIPQKSYKTNYFSVFSESAYMGSMFKASLCLLKRKASSANRSPHFKIFFRSDCICDFVVHFFLTLYFNSSRIF